jgi:hypothetical protein
MSRSVSQAALSDLYARVSESAFLPFLHIDHVDLAAPIRLVYNTANVERTGQGGEDPDGTSTVTYQHFPFDVNPPPQEPDQLSEVDLSVSNVDRRIVHAVRSLDSAPEVTFFMVRGGDPNTIEAGPWAFSLKDTRWDQIQVRGRLGFPEILDEPFPAHTYNPIDFPGLFK